MAHRTWAWLWCATLAIAPRIANATLTSTHLSHPAYRGFPDCTLGVDGHTDTCAQRPATADNQTLVACVGDSITAGYRASSSAHTYPSVLASLLGERYKVTNLGEGGATMNLQRHLSSRSSYTQLSTAPKLKKSTSLGSRLPAVEMMK